MIMTKKKTGVNEKWLIVLAIVIIFFLGILGSITNGYNPRAEAEMWELTLFFGALIVALVFTPLGHKIIGMLAIIWKWIKERKGEG